MLKKTKKNNQYKNKSLKKKESNDERVDNNFIFINNNEKNEEENKRIKEIESEIKKKREEKQKRLELIKESHNKELFKLEIKVLRKLYTDLFISLPNTFKENNLSFENFVYEFGNKIHILFELDKNNKNPSYDNLLKEVNVLILKKYPISPDLVKFNKNELKKYFYELGINDEWSLINKYQQEMDKNEERERLIKIAQSMQDYYNELDKQIETKKTLEKNSEEEKKKNLEKKRREIELKKMRLMNKKKIEKLKANEKMMEMLDKKTIEQINEKEKMKKYYLENLEELNDNLNENNYHIIKYKLDNAINIQTKQMQNYNNKFTNNSKIKEINTGYEIQDEQLDNMVDQIINKKKQDKDIINIINNYKDSDIEINLESKNDDKIEGIDYEIEKKVNQILSEQRLKKIKNKI